jgi:hypothetical protein
MKIGGTLLKSRSFSILPASQLSRQSLEKKLTDDEKMDFLAIRAYADTMLWSNEKSSSKRF